MARFSQTLLTAHDIVAVYKALGDETRLEIVRRVADKKRLTPSCEIVSACPSTVDMSQPTLSHHLAKLVAAGVLSEQKHSTQKYYLVNTHVLQQAGIDYKQLTRRKR